MTKTTGKVVSLLDMERGGRKKPVSQVEMAILKKK
jgi:hypothetical protein